MLLLRLPSKINGCCGEYPTNSQGSTHSHDPAAAAAVAAVGAAAAAGAVYEDGAVAAADEGTFAVEGFAPPLSCMLQLQQQMLLLLLFLFCQGRLR